MRFDDIKRDPFYTVLIFQIEEHIFLRDREAEIKEGLMLTDSDIKSGMRKAMSILAGNQALSPPKNARERWKGRLAIEFVGIYEDLSGKSDLTRKQFKTALLVVEDSLKTQREHHGHPRGYLDFLRDFIGQMKAEED